MVTIFIFSFLSFLLGIMLGWTTYQFQSIQNNPIVEKINTLLPQSQCAQCGHPGCYSYAQAIVQNTEDFDKCIPGGTDLIVNIAHVLNVKISKEHLIIKDKKPYSTVWIDEQECIGCAKCSLFCPVDAIVGAPNFMHTVLQDFCTGCDICLSHCPTNCIKIKSENYD